MPPASLESQIKKKLNYPEKHFNHQTKQSAIFLHEAEITLSHGVWRKLVDQPLTWHALQNLPLIVVPQSTTHLLVIHVSPVFPLTPKLSHRARVHESEYSFLALYPRDISRARFLVFQKFFEELPQVQGSCFCNETKINTINVKNFNLINIKFHLKTFVTFKGRQYLM